MKKLALAATIALSTSLVSVSANAAGLEMGSDNFETKVCYVAATEGIKTAEKMIKDKGLSVRRLTENVMCNNTDLKTFAKRHANKNISTAPVTLIATNNDIESKICIESLTNGINNTERKYRVNKDQIRCNGIPLPRFVRQNKNRDLTVSL